MCYHSQLFKFSTRSHPLICRCATTELPTSSGGLLFARGLGLFAKLFLHKLSRGDKGWEILLEHQEFVLYWGNAEKQRVPTVPDGQCLYSVGLDDQAEGLAFEMLVNCSSE